MENHTFGLKALAHRFQAGKFSGFICVTVLLTVYLSYVAFIILSDKGPVDYETFMQIGNRFLTGQPVYGENSYYPMPYVTIFAFFALLPRQLSMFLWFLLPIVSVLIIQRGKPWALLFAPVISHFLGGQTALPALLGVWGYREKSNTDNFWGGVCLALTALKPQLAIFPVVWAVVQWFRHIKNRRRIPPQFWGFLVTISIIYIPSFLFQPDWMEQWLAAPRPLFERALAGLIPRTLLYLLPGSTGYYWVFLVLISICAGCYIGWRTGWKIDFDLYMTASFLINPFAHDYDLIQLIPLLKRWEIQKSALWISIPAFLVIVSAYQVDHAWFAFTLIPFVLVWAMVKFPQTQQSAPPSRHSYADAASARQ